MPEPEIDCQTVKEGLEERPLYTTLRSFYLEFLKPTGESVAGTTCSEVTPIGQGNALACDIVRVECRITVVCKIFGTELTRQDRNPAQYAAYAALPNEPMLSLNHKE